MSDKGTHTLHTNRNESPLEQKNSVLKKKNPQTFALKLCCIQFKCKCLLNCEDSLWQWSFQDIIKNVSLPSSEKIKLSINHCSKAQSLNSSSLWFQTQLVLPDTIHKA